MISFLIIFTLCSTTYGISTQLTVLQNGTVNDDTFTGITLDDSGSFYLVGWERRTHEDTFITTFKDEVLNTTVVGAPFGDFSSDIVMDSTRGLIFVCGKLETVLNEFVAFVVAIDEETLQYVWSVEFLNQGTSQLNRLVLDPSTDSLFAVGFSFGNRSDQINQGMEDAWLLKLNAATGDIVWNRLIGSSKNDSFEDVALDSNGNVWAVGFKGGPFFNLNGSDFLIAQFNQQGDVLQIKQFGGAKEDVLERIVIDGSSMYLLATSQATIKDNGTYIVENWNYTNLVLMKMNLPSLLVEWSLTEKAADNDITVTGLFKQNSTLYVSGFTSASSFNGSSNHGPYGTYDILFAMFSASTGEMEYSELLGSYANEQANSLYVNDEKVLIVGFTNGAYGSPIAGGIDPILLELQIKEEEGEKNSKDDKVLSERVIAGIIIGASVVLILGVVVAIVLAKRRTRNSEMAEVHSEPASRKVTDAGGENETSSTFQMSQFSPIPAPPRLNARDSHTWLINYKEIEIQKKIGEGAYGEVYKAKWRGSYVAVKKMAKREGAKIEDFFAEAELMIKLRPHSNITQLMGFCERPVCIVTEYVAHGSLLTLLHSKCEITDLLKIRMIKDTASGMLHLHTEGIIHRDLAARNILLDKANRAKVSDFGMSRITNPNETRKTAAEVGPIAWMAPEALLDKIYNTKTDVWSFGVVIFEVLTRQRPYETLNLMQVGVNIAIGKLSLIPDLEANQEQYPPVLMKLAKLCLQYNPKDRPQFQEIVDILNEADGSSASQFSSDFHIKAPADATNENTNENE